MGVGLAQLATEELAYVRQYTWDDNLAPDILAKVLALEGYVSAADTLRKPNSEVRLFFNVRRCGVTPVDGGAHYCSLPALLSRIAGHLVSKT